MKQSTQLRYLAGALLCAVLIGAAIALWRTAFVCVSVSPSESIMSSHGWGTWFGETYQSFPHKGRRICVPEGWVPLGHESEGKGWARFPNEGSAVLVRPEAFVFDTMAEGASGRTLTVVYPRSLPSAEVAGYLAAIRHAFSSVERLYPSSATQTFVPHVVLITVGVAGEGTEFENSVYPEPSARLSIFVRNRALARADEMYTHAVAHLFNRYRTSLSTYLHTQSVVNDENFEELEAAWLETVFAASPERRRERIEQLYAIHTAVMNNSFNETLIYPWNYQEQFDALKVKRLGAPAGASYIDYQYAHYIVGPLILVAIDALLANNESADDVESLLQATHEHGNDFFEALRARLTEDEWQQVSAWIDGSKQVPYERVVAGLAHYAP